MSRYDADGERIDPRDVLNNEELWDYYRNRDRFPRRGFRPPITPDRIDDLGYRVVNGNPTVQEPEW